MESARMKRVGEVRLVFDLQIPLKTLKIISLTSDCIIHLVLIIYYLYICMTSTESTLDLSKDGARVCQ